MNVSTDFRALPLQIHRALLDADFTCADMVRDATDAELLRLPGIGKRSLKKIRAAINALEDTRPISPSEVRLRFEKIDDALLRIEHCLADLARK